MNRARSLAEFTYMVEQALLEVEDLRDAIEYDPEEMAEAESLVDALEPPLRLMHGQLVSGAYRFADTDLPCMELLRHAGTHFLPFGLLLKAINSTHRQGLDESQ